MDKGLLKLVVGTTLALVMPNAHDIEGKQFLNDSDIGRVDVAKFTPDGELIFPDRTDRWVALGANVGGDYSESAFDPENPGAIGVVKMEPDAYAYLGRNGTYADGTMLLLSFYDTQAAPEPELRGFVQGDIDSLEIHVIDRDRFEDGRGFFLYSADDRKPAAMLPPGNECVQCHEEHGAFRGTFTQFYPVIRDRVSNHTD